MRRGLIPTAEDLAVIPCDPPVDDESTWNRTVADAMGEFRRRPAFAEAFLFRSTAAGEIVAGLTARQIGDLRELGMIRQAGRPWLTEDGKAVRARVEAAWLRKGAK